MKNLRVKHFKDFDFKILALGVLTFLFGTVYFVEGFARNTFTVKFTFTQRYFPMYFILGVLHAYNLQTVWKLSDKRKSGIVYLVSLTLIFTGWYNVVLMPVSGLGLFQIIFVFIILASDVFSQRIGKKIKSPFIGYNPITLLTFGFVMYFIKVIFFNFFNDRIYDQISSNNTVRYLLLFCVMLTLVYLVMRLVKNLKNEIPEQKQEAIISKISKIANKMLKMIVKLAQYLLSLLSSIISLPILIPVLLVIAFTCFGFSVYKVGQFYDNILSIIESILSVLLTTGENDIKPDVKYFLCQSATFAFVSFFSFYLENQIRGSLDIIIEDKINKSVKNTADLQNMTQQQLEQIIDLAHSELLNKDLDTSLILAYHPEKIQNVVDKLTSSQS